MQEVSDGNSLQVSFTIFISVITTLCGVIATLYIMSRKDRKEFDDSKKEDTKTILNMVTEMTKVATNSNAIAEKSNTVIKDYSEAQDKVSSVLTELKTLLQTTREKK